jgi:predicted PurR-regulated permease PerM
MTAPMRSSNVFRMLLVICGIVLALGVLFAWSRILFPVLAGFLIAWVSHPLAVYFEKRHLPRILGFLLVLLIFIGLLFLIFLVFIPAIVHELMFLGQKFPTWRGGVERRISYLLVELEGRYPEAYALLKERLTQWAQENLPSLAQRLVSWLMTILGSAIGLVNTLFNLVLIPVIAAYLTIDFHKVVRTLRGLVPRPVLPTLEKVISEINHVLGVFLRGQLLVAMALGVMYTGGLLLARSPLALVIGPLAGLLSLVPYLGFIFGLGLSLMLTLLEYPGLWHPLGVVITFVVAQNVEGWVLTPRLLGKRVGLHPVWVLVALLLGAQLFGIPGMVVAVPVAAALRVVLRHAVQAYRESNFYLGLEPEIVFYTRKGCSLCAEFERLLQPMLEHRGIHFRRMDVDHSKDLKETFGSRVPVLEVNGKIIAEGRVSAGELKKRLEEMLGDLPGQK